MMLFLLCAILPFLGPSRTSWGARSAVFLLSIAAAFTHPTTCVIYGVVLMAVFGWHFLTSRFSLGSALRSDGPMLMAAGFGMIAGLAMWVVGIWGPVAKLSDAALPPPYTKEFFLARLGQWVGSLQPLIIGPLIVVAVVSTIWMARRERKPAGTYEIVSTWWMLPFLGLLHVPHVGGRSLLPVHERHGGRHAARRARRVRGDPLVHADGRDQARGRHRWRASRSWARWVGSSPTVYRTGGPARRRSGSTRTRASRSPPSMRWRPTRACAPTSSSPTSATPPRPTAGPRRSRTSCERACRATWRSTPRPTSARGRTTWPGEPTIGEDDGYTRDLQGLLRGGAGAGRQVHG